MAPFVSEAQSRWGHSNAGVKALGGQAHVKEWEQSTDYKRLSERKGKGNGKGGKRKLLMAKVKAVAKVKGK